MTPTVDDAVIDDGLLIVRRMWDAGLAHRDIKPANLLVRDGHLLLIDVAFAEVRPTPWRQAVDLANMMLCLALRSSAERVYQRALQYFTVTEISEAFAAARGIALPSQLRHAIRASGRDLHEEFLQLLPHRPAPVRVQRWSTRRVGTSAAVLVAAFLLVIALANSLLSSATPATALRVTSMDCHALQPLLAEAQSVHSHRSGVHPAAAPRLDPEPGPGAARHIGHHTGQRPGRQRRAAADPDRALRGRPGRGGPGTRARNQAAARPGRRCPVRSHLV